MRYRVKKRKKGLVPFLFFITMNPVTNAQGQAAESSSTSIKDASINAPNVNTTVSTTNTKAAVSTSPGKIGVCFDNPFFFIDHWE